MARSVNPLYPVFIAGLIWSAQSLWAADDIREIQMRRLLQPTDAELAQERKGRIYIYESLTHQDIEQAMDDEFERVESMMFIRVPKTDESGDVIKDKETGEVVIEDDGC
ncbi:hypothetical protein [Halochromatium glycolicum]|uniref:Uncharacterized protein n=1 Tax=Halochromatium glycolicum TaxID=85075 RepID=A0AAJ0XCF3_9GAMM|nr:hypothetical protein [Halochromatium glycolicum]MBK1707150.1 hypothetical protein [Halochromatium glycolicum]